MFVLCEPASVNMFMCEGISVNISMLHLKTGSSKVLDGRSDMHTYHVCVPSLPA